MSGRQNDGKETEKAGQGGEGGREGAEIVGGVLFHRWKQTHGRWPKPGINYRVVVLAIVFNCGDA